MQHKGKHITVFEHQTVKLHQKFEGGYEFDEQSLNALQRFYGTGGVPYFTLTHRGVRFNEYVGVLQVGDLVIEVLPKADKTSEPEEPSTWRNVLIGMLRAVGTFDVHAPSTSSLHVKPNSILDLYIGLFIHEVEYLLHTGLAKRYRKKEGNVSALKGNLLFAKHLQYNLTHQERFYVRHTTYDVEHLLHCILYKTILLLRHINTNADLHSRIGALLLHFPEMPEVNVTEATFARLVLDRKTQAYKKALDIAKLLLLQYHPDIRAGRNDILALMFDMNRLWEEFVFASLQKYKPSGCTVTAQSSKRFWQSDNGGVTSIRPDIVIHSDMNECLVLDTKWKNIGNSKPSPEDLRQMYVYHEYFHAQRVALVYPGKVSQVRGQFLHPHSTNLLSDKECHLVLLPVCTDMRKWQESIAARLFTL